MDSLVDDSSIATGNCACMEEDTVEDFDDSDIEELKPYSYVWLSDEELYASEDDCAAEILYLDNGNDVLNLESGDLRMLTDLELADTSRKSSTGNRENYNMACSIEQPEYTSHVAKCGGFVTESVFKPFNSYKAAMKTFANTLDPDQAPLHEGPDQDPNGFALAPCFYSHDADEPLSDSSFSNRLLSVERFEELDFENESNYDYVILPDIEDQEIDSDEMHDSENRAEIEHSKYNFVGKISLEVENLSECQINSRGVHSSNGGRDCELDGKCAVDEMRGTTVVTNVRHTKDDFTATRKHCMKEGSQSKSICKLDMVEQGVSLWKEVAVVEERVSHSTAILEQQNDAELETSLCYCKQVTDEEADGSLGNNERACDSCVRSELTPQMGRCKSHNKHVVAKQQHLKDARKRKSTRVVKVKAISNCSSSIVLRSDKKQKVRKKKSKHTNFLMKEAAEFIGKVAIKYKTGTTRGKNQTRRHSKRLAERPRLNYQTLTKKRYSKQNREESRGRRSKDISFRNSIKDISVKFVFPTKPDDSDKPQNIPDDSDEPGNIPDDTAENEKISDDLNECENITEYSDENENITDDSDTHENITDDSDQTESEVTSESAGLSVDMLDSCSFIPGHSHQAELEMTIENEVRNTDNHLGSKQQRVSEVLRYHKPLGENWKSLMPTPTFMRSLKITQAGPASGTRQGLKRTRTESLDGLNKSPIQKKSEVRNKKNGGCNKTAQAVSATVTKSSKRTGIETLDKLINLPGRIQKKWVAYNRCKLCDKACIGVPVVHCSHDSMPVVELDRDDVSTYTDLMSVETVDKHGNRSVLIEGKSAEHKEASGKTARHKVSRKRRLDGQLNRGRRKKFPCKYCGLEYGKPYLYNHESLHKQNGYVRRWHRKYKQLVACGGKQQSCGGKQEGEQQRCGGKQKPYGDKQNKFGGKQQRYGDKQQIFGGKQQRYGDRQQNFGGKQQIYEEKQQIFGDKQQRYGGKQQNYGDQPQTFRDKQHRSGDKQQRCGGKQQRGRDKQQKFGDQQERYGSKQQRFGDKHQRFGDKQQRAVSCIESVRSYSSVKPSRVSCIEPVRSRSVKPSRVSCIEPVRSRSVKPSRVSYIEPVRSRSVKPSRVSCIEPVRSRSVKPSRVSCIEPVRSRSVKPSRVSCIEPVRSRSVKPSRVSCIEPVRSRSVKQSIVISPVDTRTFKCSLCYYSTNCFSQLNNHNQLHRQSEVVWCWQCHVVFKTARAGKIWHTKNRVQHQEEEETDRESDVTEGCGILKLSGATYRMERTIGGILNYSVKGIGKTYQRDASDLNNNTCVEGSISVDNMALDNAGKAVHSGVVSNRPVRLHTGDDAPSSNSLKPAGSLTCVSCNFVASSMEALGSHFIATHFLDSGSTDNNNNDQSYSSGIMSTGGETIDDNTHVKAHSTTEAFGGFAKKFKAKKPKNVYAIINRQTEIGNVNTVVQLERTAVRSEDDNCKSDLTARDYNNNMPSSEAVTDQSLDNFGQILADNSSSTAVELLSCLVCESSFPVKADLMKHLTRIHRLTNLCQLCYFKQCTIQRFANPVSLRNHKLRHHPEDMVKCTCGAMLIDEKMLMSHQKKFKCNESETEKYGSQMVKCVCGKRFGTLDQLSGHKMKCRKRRCDEDSESNVSGCSYETSIQDKTFASPANKVKSSYSKSANDDCRDTDVRRPVRERKPSKHSVLEEEESKYLLADKAGPEREMEYKMTKKAACSKPKKVVQGDCIKKEHGCVSSTCGAAEGTVSASLRLQQRPRKQVRQRLGRKKLRPDAEGRYPCKVCKRRFKRPYLYVHQKNAHQRRQWVIMPTAVPFPKQVNGGTTFRCGWCKFVAVHWRNVVQHHYGKHPDMELDVISMVTKPSP